MIDEGVNSALKFFVAHASAFALLQNCSIFFAVLLCLDGKYKLNRLEERRSQSRFVLGKFKPPAPVVLKDHAKCNFAILSKAKLGEVDFCICRLHSLAHLMFSMRSDKHMLPYFFFCASVGAAVSSDRSLLGKWHCGLSICYIYTEYVFDGICLAEPGA